MLSVPGSIATFSDLSILEANCYQATCVVQEPFGLQESPILLQPGTHMCLPVHFRRIFYADSLSATSHENEAEKFDCDKTVEELRAEELAHDTEDSMFLDNEESDVCFSLFASEYIQY